MAKGEDSDMIEFVRYLGLAVLVFIIAALAGWLGINAVITPGNQFLEVAVGGLVTGLLAGLAALKLLEE